LITVLLRTFDCKTLPLCTFGTVDGFSDILKGFDPFTLHPSEIQLFLRREVTASLQSLPQESNGENPEILQRLPVDLCRKGGTQGDFRFQGHNMVDAVASEG